MRKAFTTHLDAKAWKTRGISTMRVAFWEEYRSFPNSYNIEHCALNSGPGVSWMFP